uniref:Solute carrier family 66 member 1 like n=1 Tax=Anolis carolinensis TaxID=28377 RepID=G1KUR2_ANOCA
MLPLRLSHQCLFPQQAKFFKIQLLQGQKVRENFLNRGTNSKTNMTGVLTLPYNGKVDQALSLGFLLCWIAGDLTNFIGCYLTNQLPIQIITAIFYIYMDIIMISQFAYYKLKNQKVTKCGTNLKNGCIAWLLLCIVLCMILPSQLLL